MIAQALRTALLDFVWQGLLAAFVLWAALLVLRKRPPRARYLACCVALAVMAVLPAVTACLVYTAPAAHQVSATAIAVAPHAPTAVRNTPLSRSLSWAAGIESWMLPLWSLGVLLFSLRLVWAARHVSLVRRRAAPPGDAVLDLVSALARRMRLDRPVRALLSNSADCPSVAGWLRPVLVLPAATLAGLTPPQLEAVLAHELAHILRYDYLVNMLQSVVETLLFYHPAVWWTSARIRHERELCCDDLAVESCGDAVLYARALTRLERLRLAAPQLSLGGGGGSLLYRIERLTGGRTALPSKLPGILALSLGLACLVFNMQALNMQSTRAAQQQANPAPPLAAAAVFAPDDPGVRVDLGSASVVHRDGVEYPAAAMAKGVHGTVVVEGTLDASGAVTDARVVRGPQELRKAALESVLEWRFTPGAAGRTTQVRIEFAEPSASSIAVAREYSAVDSLIEEELAHKLDLQLRALRDRQNLLASEQAGKMAEMAAALQSRLQAAQLQKQVEALLHQRTEMGAAKSALAEARQSQIAAMTRRLADVQATLNALRRQNLFAGQTVKSIVIEGLDRAARRRLLAALPVHMGDTLAADSFDKIQAALKSFGGHLGLSMSNNDGQVEIRITAAPAQRTP